MLSSYLPKNLYEAIKNIPYESLCELRLRANDCVIVNILGENYYLSSESFSKDKSEAIIVNFADIQYILQKISNNSLYTINDQLIDGYVTINGGIRVGICGEIVMIDGKIKTIKNISSLNFRFPHLIKNCSLDLMKYIYRNNYLKNTLIVSPPGAGKTTYLRDIIYQLSHIDNLFNILVVDERQELTKIFDGDRVIDLKNVDIYSNCSKKFGFENGIRSMKPNVVITDEINIEKDLEIIELALTSGVKVIASIHADNIFDLKNKSAFNTLLHKRLFERFVVLSNVNGIGTIDGIFDENLNFLGV